jgi:glycosyltransferase involved in cell wall biosynthesis
MSKTNITAIVLCKNGQDTLAKCLDSLHFCDAIIVGDDASTDTSIEIAKSHHADVIKVPAGKDFSQKRNFLLEYARTEWVLFVDTDEVVSKELVEEITKNQESGSKNQGFYIRRQDVFMGKKLMHGETAHTKLLRLARVGTGKWKRSVHEVWDIPGPIGELSGELLHYSHPTLGEFLDKINRYTEIEAKFKLQISNSKKRSKLEVQTKNYFQLFVYPIAKFIQNYFFRLGILDGYPGFIMAWMMSFHSLCVRIKVLEKL